MNTKPTAVLWILLLASVRGITAERPGDSVTNGLRPGNASIALDQGIGHTSLLSDVAMASQTDLDHFVEYGPFWNRSNATLAIRLLHIGGAEKHTVAGIVGGRVIASHADAVTFNVAPGEQYSFLAKDYTSISASANRNGLDYAMTGLPRAESFLRPQGNFLRCVEVMDPELQMLHTYYFYAAGSMSDSSQRRDDISGIVPGVTGGVRPSEAVVCERRDRFW